MGAIPPDPRTTKNLFFEIAQRLSGKAPLDLFKPKPIPLGPPAPAKVAPQATRKPAPKNKATAPSVQRAPALQEPSPISQLLSGAPAQTGFPKLLQEIQDENYRLWDEALTKGKQRTNARVIEAGEVPGTIEHASKSLNETLGTKWRSNEQTRQRVYSFLAIQDQDQGKVSPQSLAELTRAVKTGDWRAIDFRIKTKQNEKFPVVDEDVRQQESRLNGRYEPPDPFSRYGFPFTASDFLVALRGSRRAAEIDPKLEKEVYVRLKNARQAGQIEGGRTTIKLADAIDLIQSRTGLPIDQVLATQSKAFPAAAKMAKKERAVAAFEAAKGGPDDAFDDVWQGIKALGLIGSESSDDRGKSIPQLIGEGPDATGRLPWWLKDKIQGWAQNVAAGVASRDHEGGEVTPEAILADPQFVQSQAAIKKGTDIGLMLPMILYAIENPAAAKAMLALSYGGPIAARAGAEFSSDQAKQVAQERFGQWLDSFNPNNKQGLDQAMAIMQSLGLVADVFGAAGGVNRFIRGRKTPGETPLIDRGGTPSALEKHLEISEAQKDLRQELAGHMKRNAHSDPADIDPSVIEGLAVKVAKERGLDPADVVLGHEQLKAIHAAVPESIDEFAKSAKSTAKDEPLIERGGEQATWLSQRLEIARQADEAGAVKVETEQPPAPPAAKLAETSEVPQVHGAAWVDPATIKINDGIQYKSGITDQKAKVTGQFKDVEVFDIDQAGEMTVWQRLDGSQEVVDGHHRLDMANRALRFISTRKRPGEAVEVPRQVKVVPLLESEGWTLEKVRAQGALQNIRDAKGTPLDAAKVIRDLGQTREGLKDLGMAMRGNMGRNVDGLMQLSDESIQMVDRGMIPEEVAAGIGAAELTPAQQQAAFRAGSKLRTFEEGLLFGRKIKSRPVTGTQEGSLFDGDEEFASYVSTVAEETRIQDLIRRALSRERGDLLTMPKKILDGENLDIDTRNKLASEYGESSQNTKDRIDFLFDHDPDLQRMITHEASEVIHGRTTAEESSGRLLEAVRTKARGDLARYLRADWQEGVQQSEQPRPGSGETSPTQDPVNAPDENQQNLFGGAGGAAMVGSGLENDDEETKGNLVIGGLAILAAIFAHRGISRSAWGSRMKAKFGSAIEPWLDRGWKHSLSQAFLEPRLYAQQMGGRTKFAIERLLEAKGDWHVRAERDLVEIGGVAEKVFGPGWKKSKEVQQTLQNLRDRVEADDVTLTAQEQALVDGLQKIHAKFGPWAWKLGIGVDDVNAGDMEHLIGSDVRAIVDNDGVKMKLTGKVKGIDGKGGIIFEHDGVDYRIAKGARFDRPIHELGTKFVPRILRPEFVEDLKKMTSARRKAAEKLVETGKTNGMDKAYEQVDAMAKARTMAEGGRPVFWQYSEKFEQIADDLFKSNPTEFSGIEDARAWLMDAGEHLAQEKDLITFMSSLEKARRIKFASEHYVSDYLEAFGKYVDRTHKRIAIAEALGNPDPRALDELLRGVKEVDALQGDYLERSLIRLFRLGEARGQDRPEFRRMAAAEGSVQSMLKLTGGTTQLAQLSDLVQVMTRVETSSALKGIRDMFSRNKRLDSMILSGAHRDIMGDVLREDPRGGLQQAADFVHTWTLIKGLDSGVKTLSMSIALRDVETLLKRGVGGKLGAADARRAARYGMTPDDIALGPSALSNEKTLNRIAERVRADLSYTGAAEHNPLWMSSPGGAVFMRLKKPVYYVSKFLIRDVLGEAGHGNFKPLAKLLVYGGLAGTGIEEFRNWLDQKEPNIEEEITKDAPLSRKILLYSGIGLDRLGNAGAMGLAKDLTKPYNFDITGRFDLLSAAAPTSVSDFRNWIGTMSEMEWTQPMREILGLKDAKEIGAQEWLREVGKSVPLVRRIKKRVDPE